jgi:N-acetylglucosamine transport system substrate-binding protein
MKRREFLYLTAGMTLSALLASCKPKSGGGGGGGAKDAYLGFDARSVSWKNIPADHQKGTLIPQDEWYKMLGDPPEEIEAAFWLEGWGHGWVQFVADMLEKEHPGAKVKIWGDPRIWETLQPRLVDGDIPDVGRQWITGGEQSQIQGVRDKVYAPCDILLDVEAYGQPGKRVADVLLEGSLERAAMGLTDAQWAMPFVQGASGIYYNVTMFEEHGWPAPDEITWEEFIELGEEIKKAGIAPWTYQGKYPGYMDQVLTPLMYKKAGQQALCDIDNLKEGAWKNPDIMWAMEQLQLMFASDWVFPGAEAMSHTEGQQIFMDGKAAMVPCGTWLEREQEETTPEGFRMALSAVPAPKDAKGFAKAISASPGGPELVVGNGKNPLWGMEFVRLTLSMPTAKYIAENVGGALSIKDALQGANVSEALQSAVDRVAAAEGHYIQTWFGAWYPTIGKVRDDNWGDLLWSRISVEELTDQLERAAKEVREDSTITKNERTDCS